MRKLYQAILAGGAIAVAIPAAMVTTNSGLFAADHLDPPTRTDPAVDTTADRAADIADVYAWHTADKLIIAMTFSGPQATTVEANYDRDVLYQINISNDGNKATTEFPIEVRFGKAGDLTGVQFRNVPGTNGPIEGPVETDLTRDGVIARAGLFDDPFFFDLQGFKDTRSTGTLAFDKTRNFFKGQNLTAIVLEIPRTAVANGTNPIAVWGSTARFGGQL